MANTCIDSYGTMLAADFNTGLRHHSWFDRVTVSGTAATSSCGYNSCARFPNPFIVPTLGGGVNGVYLGAFDVLASSNANTCYVLGLEVLLGTLTVSGNSYADGSAMPSRVVLGDSIQLGSIMPMAYISTTLTATTPVLTVTYTDQSGNTAHTATLTLPTNSLVNSAFLIAPHLASGDTGIQDLKASSPNGLSISTGSAGVIKVYGVVPLAFSLNSFAPFPGQVDPICMPWPLVRLVGGDVLAVYQLGSASASDMLASISLIPETN